MRGSVRVRVESAWPERILNLCSARRIELREPRWHSATELSFSVSRRDFPAFKRAIANTGAQWSLERKEGAPYFLGRFRRRHALLAGLAVFAALLVVNSLFIWDFEVSGNDTVPAEKILRVTDSIIREHNLTCLMITHNMQSALELGNRTIMMDKGKIVTDVSGNERAALTVNDLLLRFREISGKALDNDRMLLI